MPVASFPYLIPFHIFPFHKNVSVKTIIKHLMPKRCFNLVPTYCFVFYEFMMPSWDKYKAMLNDNNFLNITHKLNNILNNMHFPTDIQITSDPALQHHLNYKMK